MFPACLDPGAVARFVSHQPGDGPQRPRHQRHIQRNFAGLARRRRCGHRARRNCHRRNQPGRQDRALQVLLLGPLVQVASLEPGDPLQMARRQEPRITADHVAERILAARLDRHSQVAFLALVIDEQVGRAHFGKGITGLAQIGVQPVAASHDPVIVERIAGRDPEPGPQRGIIRPCQRQVAQIDRPEAIAVPRHHIEPHPDILRLRILGSLDQLAAFDVGIADRLGHDRIVIAIDPQQPRDQVAVCPRPRGDLRDAVLMGVKLAHGRQRPEPVKERGAFGECRQIGRKHQRQVIGNLDLLALHGARRQRIGRSLGQRGRHVRIGRQRGQLRGLPQSVRPRQREPGQFGQRRGRIDPHRRICRNRRHRHSGIPGQRILRPVFRIGDRRIRDQVFQLGFRILRRRADRGQRKPGRQHSGQRRHQQALRRIRGRYPVRTASRPWPGQTARHHRQPGARR